MPLSDFLLGGTLGVTVLITFFTLLMVSNAMSPRRTRH